MISQVLHTLMVILLKIKWWCYRKVCIWSVQSNHIQNKIMNSDKEKRKKAPAQTEQPQSYSKIGLTFHKVWETIYHFCQNWPPKGPAQSFVHTLSYSYCTLCFIQYYYQAKPESLWCFCLLKAKKYLQNSHQQQPYFVLSANSNCANMPN